MPSNITLVAIGVAALFIWKYGALLFLNGTPVGQTIQGHIGEVSR
jgi:hypothetical protein